MFGGIRNGVLLVVQALQALVRHPGLVAPLLLCWIAYATGTGYLKYFFDWDAYGRSRQIAIALGCVAALATLFSFASMVLLGLVAELEEGGRPSLLRAVGGALGAPLLRALPITVAWAALWGVVAFGSRVVAGGDFSVEPQALTAEGIARSLSGVQPLPFSSLLLSATLLRYGAFFLFPAIAWEQRGCVEGARRGLTVLLDHRVEAVVGLALIQLVTGLLFLPAGVLFLLSALHVHLPDKVWFAAIFASGLAWSVAFYLEQLFAAQLFRWHALWEDAQADAAAQYREAPEFEDVDPPRLLSASGRG